MPQVLNKRTDGYPESAVYIGRAMPRYGLPASKWANPFRLYVSLEERMEAIGRDHADIIDREGVAAAHDRSGEGVRSV
jgi:hypothetical protein